MADEGQIAELLREIVHWLRFQNRQALKAAVDGILVTDTDRKIYGLTDGEKSQPEIARRVGVSQPTISGKWKAWRKLGIVYEMPDEPGRCRHLASLESLGLEAR